MTSAVRKVVFPAAGLGTRFLPATKAQPKEMLPLVDKPIIQYGVEEAVASGVDNIILVTGRGKNAIEDHFDVNIELETFLEARNKTEQLEEVRKISNMINVAYVRQGEPLGLGHAVLVTAELIGNEPFAVILADDVIDAEPPALKQMMDVYDKVGGPVLAVERVPADQVSAYGIVDIDPSAQLGEGIHLVRDLVEKPAREEVHRRTSPSSAATSSRRTSFGAQGHGERPHGRDPADERPEEAASASGRSTRTKCRARATTPATSSAISKRSCISR